MSQVKVYGADWCHDTQATLAELKELQVPFDYIDIEADPKAAAWVRDQNNGKEKKPTLDIDGQVLSVPSNQELQQVLREQQLL